MDTGGVWRKLFLEWPKELPRRGVAVTSFDEQIPFDGFLTSEGLLVLERRTPDTIGARKVILPYESIVGLKLTDVIRGKLLNSIGFAGELKE